MANKANREFPKSPDRRSGTTWTAAKKKRMDLKEKNKIAYSGVTTLSCGTTNNN
jgi:hypothetical protein